MTLLIIKESIRHISDFSFPSDTLSGSDIEAAKKHKNSVHKHKEFNVDGNVTCTCQCRLFIWTTTLSGGLVICRTQQNYETKIDTTQSNSLPYDERTRNKRCEFTTSTFSKQNPHHVRFPSQKITEPSWSYVIEKQERWNGLVIKDLC